MRHAFATAEQEPWAVLGIVGVHPAFQIDMANGQVWRLQYLRVIERDPVLAVGQLSVEDAVVDAL